MFMKKLLLSTMMLAAGLFAANAAEETIQFTDWYGTATVSGIDAQGPKTQGDITVTFAKGNSQNAPAFNKALEVRLYGGKSADVLDGNTMTVEVPEGMLITSIYLEVGQVDKWGVMTADSGSVEEDADKNATWTGSASTVVLTANRNSADAGVSTQNRYKSMTVTYSQGEVTKCSAPRFNPAAGTYWGSVSVELTCNTDGATMYYTINDGAEQTYSAPIELAEAGTYEINAYAKKDGIDDSDVATATYVVSEPVQCSSIEDYIFNAESEGEGSMFEWTFPVTVVYTMPSYTYVRDEEGSAMLIYGSEVPAYESGDIIPAGIIGGFTNYNGLYEMQNVNVESFGEATSKGNGSPIVMTAGEITADDMNQVVYLDNVTLTWTPNEKYGDPEDIKLTDASGSVNAFDQYRWELEYPASGTEVDLICAVAVYNSNIQVYPMQFLDASNTPDFGGVEGVVAGNTIVKANADGIVVVAAEAAEVSVYTAAGQLVAAENVAAGETVIGVPAGFYVVKAGNTVAKVIVK